MRWLAGRRALLAPFLVATVTALSGSPRLGMAMILLFLVGGMAVLWPTPYPADVPKGMTRLNQKRRGACASISAGSAGRR